MKKFVFIIGILFLAAFCLWKLLIEYHFTERIPARWSFEAEYLGSILWADKTGRVHNQKDLTLYQRFWKVQEWHHDRAVIEDIYKTIDVQSGEVTWETKLQFIVDPYSGKIVSNEKHPEAIGLFYIFPQNVEKKDYEFFNYDLYPHTMRYQRQESREGLDLYVFSFKGKIDFTELYHYAYVTPTANPIGEYKIIVDNFYRELWVEPVTGEIVNIIEDDPGDYLVDSSSGRKVKLQAIWWGKTTGNTVKYLLNRAKTRSWQINLFQRWIPGLFLAFAISFLVLTCIAHLTSKRGEG